MRLSSISSNFELQTLLAAQIQAIQAGRLWLYDEDIHTRMRMTSK
jgi:hypothetical protein